MLMRLLNFHFLLLFQRRLFFLFFLFFILFFFLLIIDLNRRHRPHQLGGKVQAKRLVKPVAKLGAQFVITTTTSTTTTTVLFYA